MKKIVYGVYHDVNREARSHEMLECLCRVGKVDFVSYASVKDIDGINEHIIDKNSPFALFNFLNQMKKTILQVKPDIVMLHDNDCSALIPFVKKHIPEAKLLYDSSELYIPMPGWKAPFISPDGILVTLKLRITRFKRVCEKKYLKDVDTVFAANIERAKIMKDYFGLEKLPEVFDNIHRIEDEFDIDKCEEKFAGKFDDNGFNVLFAGGISEERKTFEYIESFKTLGSGFNLIIAGTASPKALSQYKSMTVNCDNIHYIGLVTRAELRYCMQKSQASVVIFDCETYNTKYCASGKCYESLFEGVPILASENPPLKRLCTESKIGVSDNNYADAIRKVKENYVEYVESVEKYIKQLNYDERLNKLTKIIEQG